MLHGKEMSSKQSRQSTSKWPTSDKTAEGLNELAEQKNQNLLFKMENLIPNGSHIGDTEDSVSNAQGSLLVHHQTTKSGGIWNKNVFILSIL